MDVKFRDVQSRLSTYRTRKKTAQILESDRQSLNADHNIKVDSKSSKSSIFSCDVNINKVKDSGPIKVEEKNESATVHTSDSLTCSWILVAVKCIIWLGGLGVFIHFGFGSVFLMLSAFYLIYASLRGSRRRPWEPSAYSVFNKNCESIDGTLKAEDFEREIRGRHF